MSKANRSPDKLVKKIVIHSKALNHNHNHHTVTTKHLASELNKINVITNTLTSNATANSPLSPSVPPMVNRHSQQQHHHHKSHTLPISESLLGKENIYIKHVKQSATLAKEEKPTLSATTAVTAPTTSTSTSASYNGARVSFQPNTQFSRQSKQQQQQQHVVQNKSGGDSVKRHGSLYLKGYLPRSESVLQYDKVRNEIESTIRLFIEEKKKFAAQEKEDKTKNVAVATPPSANNQDLALKTRQVAQMRERKSTLEAAKNRYSQVYERYQSNSDCSTIGELKCLNKTSPMPKKTDDKTSNNNQPKSNQTWVICE